MAGEVLPSWLVQDAKLAYMSRSSGKSMDVTVKHISQSQKAVIVVFAKDGKSEMKVPISQILDGSSPLKPREADTETKPEDPEKLLDAMEGSWESAKEKKQKVALGTGINKFSFQGPSAPPMMEILSSPEHSSIEQVEPGSRRKNERQEKQGKKAKENPTGKEKEKGKDREREKNREREKDQNTSKGRDKEVKKSARRKSPAPSESRSRSREKRKGRRR